MKTSIRTSIIAALFATAALAQAQEPEQPSLIGEWTTNYGRYSETLTYHKNGTFDRSVSQVRGPNTDAAPAKTSGVWALNQNELTQTSGEYTQKENITFISPTKFEYPDQSAPNGKLVYEKSKSVQKPEGKLQVTEPKIGSPERTAIMDAMRGPVSEYAGKTVIFTGAVQMAGDWATLNGRVTPKNGGNFPADKADELEMDFFAVLKKLDGKWGLKYFGFSGDIGTRIEARQKCPDAPEVLLPHR